MIAAPAFFAALSDPTRLRIVVLLAQGKDRGEELCVCRIVEALGLAQPKISRHLALLRETGVVQDRRQGQWIHYSIAQALEPWARDVVAGATSALRGQEPYRGDLARLAAGSAADAGTPAASSAAA